ncbi:PIN domain-containing protein [Sphaerotilus sp.]|uniref:PIN domain-containing protein n=1 Tax=Sphaerotilus sp. TaxID=2093942 RepID=UPI0025E930E0|nr:PIN domain-containing protein [Sphaerotilus sp.]
MPPLYLSPHHPPAPVLDLNGHPPRVVLDTVVVASALVFGGSTAGRLRRAWRQGFCRPMVCHQTLFALAHHLGQSQLGFTLAEQQQMLGEYLPYVLKVRVASGANPAEVGPAGLAFVQLAMAGQAHVLVTSDPSLLAMAERLPFAVLALEPFLHLLRGSPIDPVPLRSPTRQRR